MVYEDLTLTFGGITRTANEDFPEARVWTNSNSICIETLAAGTVHVYNLAGQLYKQQRVAEGTTVILAGHGFYVVRMSDKIWKVIVK